MNPLISAPSQASATVQQAVDQIREALPEAKTIGDTDKKNVYSIIKMVQPVWDDQGRATAKIFEPKDSDFKIEQLDFTNNISDTITTISSSVTNPLAAMMGSQGALLGQVLPKLTGTGGNSLVQSFFDQVEATLRSFFLLGPNSETNLAGLMLFSIEQTLPSMENTVGYVKKMEKIVKDIMQGCSGLPPAFIPEIPHLVIVQKLCKADSEIAAVEATISNTGVLDQPALANASDMVCAARDMVMSGTVKKEDLGILQKLFNLSDIQANQIASMRFTPDPTFRLKLDQLQTLNSFIQQNDAQISALNTNVIDLQTTLAEITNVGIASLMLAMLQTVQARIVTLRTQLETETVNFIRQNGYTVPDRIVTETNVGTVPYSADELSAILKGNAKAQALLQTYSTVINNAVTYTELSALCIVLSKINGMYDSLMKVMTQQGKILSGVMAFVKKHIKSRCNQVLDSSGVDAAVTAFVNATYTRLSGQSGTNQAVMTTGQALLDRLKEYRGYVGCIHGSMSGGRIDISNILNTIPGLPGQAPVSVGNIAQLTRLLPQMKQALYTLDIKRIVGVEKKEYDALTRILDGLKTLASASANALVQNLAGLYQVVFAKELDKRTSIALTVGNLCDVPAIAFKVGADYLAKNISKMLNSLEQFVGSADIVNASTPTNMLLTQTLTESTITPSGPQPGTKAAADAADEAARSAAAAVAVPFSR